MKTRAWDVAALLLAGLLTVGAGGAQAQGCIQCRETVGQTPARTQTAYRRGIAVLGLAAAGLFTATLLVGRRFRPGGKGERLEPHRPDIGD